MSKLQHTLRRDFELVSQYDEKFYGKIEYRDPRVEYEGSVDLDEDIADYVANSCARFIRGTVIA